MYVPVQMNTPNSPGFAPPKRPKLLKQSDREKETLRNNEVSLKNNNRSNDFLNANNSKELTRDNSDRSLLLTDS